MPQPETYSFSRYLAAKKSVDDRSLNRHVWDILAGHLRARQGGDALHILEIGAGIGTMIERAIEWELLPADAQWTAIEPEMSNVSVALERLRGLATERGWIEAAGKLEVRLEIPDSPLLVNFQTVDLETYARTHRGPGRFNLVIAHAVLDLLNIPAALQQILTVAVDDSLFYFTLNFDGATILQPDIDPALDRQIEELYHRTMDQRVTNGKPSGDRYTGRHLFQNLKAQGIDIMASGSSDWVVHSGPRGYEQDEAYFLHFIVHTIQTALAEHPELDAQRFTEWVAERHRQIERGELVYIAHQLDILGRR